jgi:hypothetical protein
VFHVGWKHANLITKPTFCYIHLRLLTQISVPLSLNIHYRLTHDLGTASCAVYKAVVLMIAICQDIRRPESPHLQSRIALLRAPGVSNSGICIDWLRVSGVPRFWDLSALYRRFIFIWQLSFITSRRECGRSAKWATLILWMSRQEVARNGCEVKSWPYLMRLVWLGESHTDCTFICRVTKVR